MNHTTVPLPWRERTALNLTRVITDGAGDVLVSASQFFRVGQVNMGIQIQAIGTSVTPSFTLCDPEVARDEDLQAQVTWVPQTKVNTGDMKLFPLATTALKLHFDGPGEALVVSW